VRPAIVVNPSHSLRVVTEEQFGPVIPVIPFDSEEEVVRMANDTWAGNWFAAMCGPTTTARTASICVPRSAA